MTDAVLTQVRGVIGHITLNRPEALHALNLPMCTKMLQALKVWKDDRGVALVLVDHADGSRGFCAGGDIAMLAASGRGDALQARAFFAEEYRLNAAIKAFPKPYIAIIDGVTMGGGVGLSVHGSHVIATERTVFAMPETGIGLFPDVGGGWFLPRLKGELGTWLALTGTRLKGADVLAAGIATHFVASDRIGDLKGQIADAGSRANTKAQVGAVLNALGSPAASFQPELPIDLIDRCFGNDSAEGIIDALLAEGGDWAQSQAQVLRQKSPETVKLALRQLREGRGMASFEANMAMEYRIGWRKVQSHDFLEGVRAVIIDKDQSPRWFPAQLEDVTDDDVARYFAPLGADELQFDP